MNRTEFAAAAVAPAAGPNPAKHVNFHLGMLLGVDDLDQEFAYLSGRDQWLARDLIGYGTASGLAVSVRVDEGRTRVHVSPGVAVSPAGHLIRVTSAQCADLGTWVAANPKLLPLQLGSPPLPSPPPGGAEGLVRLYVVLRYRRCPTDDVYV